MTWNDLDIINYYSFFCFFLFCPKIPQAAIFGNFLFQVFAATEMRDDDCCFDCWKLILMGHEGCWHAIKKLFLKYFFRNLSKKVFLQFNTKVLKNWKVSALSKNGPFFQIMSLCLKITEKVSFYNTSSGVDKCLVKMPKMVNFGEFWKPE